MLYTLPVDYYGGSNDSRENLRLEANVGTTKYERNRILEE
jgi:hypothetical protein